MSDIDWRFDGRHHRYAFVKGYKITRWGLDIPALDIRAGRVVVHGLDYDGRATEPVGEFDTVDAALAEVDQLTSVLHLEVHVCDQRRSYLATFEGPDGDALAMAFMQGLTAADQANGYPYGNHAYHETTGKPYDYERFPQVSAYLNPTCEHGMSAHLCYGPAHYCSPEEIAQGW